MDITIEEVIEKIKKEVEENRNTAEECRELAKNPMNKVMFLSKMYEKDANNCTRKADMQEQLIAWLEELLEYRKFGDIRDIEKVMGTYK